MIYIFPQRVDSKKRGGGKARYMVDENFAWLHNKRNDGMGITVLGPISCKYFWIPGSLPKLSAQFAFKPYKTRPTRPFVRSSRLSKKALPMVLRFFQVVGYKTLARLYF